MARGGAALQALGAEIQQAIAAADAAGKFANGSAADLYQRALADAAAGRHRRAAYVYARLLGDLRSAAIDLHPIMDQAQDMPDVVLFWVKPPTYTFRLKTSIVAASTGGCVPRGSFAHAYQ